MNWLLGATILTFGNLVATVYGWPAESRFVIILANQVAGFGFALMVLR
jgi:hypothetical protein